MTLADVVPYVEENVYRLLVISVQLCACSMPPCIIWDSHTLFYGDRVKGHCWVQI